MIYPFHCDSCQTAIEVVRRAADSGLPEYCPKCKAAMRRIYTVPQVFVEGPTYYDHGLGGVVSNRRGKKELLKRTEERVGFPIQEVGNEKKKPKPVKRDYEIPRGALDGLSLTG